MMSGVLLGMVVTLHLLIAQYGYLALLTCFYWFWYLLIPVFLPSFTPTPLHMLKLLLLYYIIIIIFISFRNNLHTEVTFNFANINLDVTRGWLTEVRLTRRIVQITACDRNVFKLRKLCKCTRNKAGVNLLRKEDENPQTVLQRCT
jgi:hypothetical protein